MSKDIINLDGVDWVILQTKNGDKRFFHIPSLVKHYEKFFPEATKDNIDEAVVYAFVKETIEYLEHAKKEGDELEEVIYLHSNGMVWPLAGNIHIQILKKEFFSKYKNGKLPQVYYTPMGEVK